MAKKQLSEVNNPEIRVIHDRGENEPKVFSVQWDDEEAYLDLPSMRRVNYLNTAKARTLEAKNRNLLTEVEEARIVIGKELGKPFFDGLDEVHDLIHIGGFEDSKSKLVNERIHAILVGLKASILELDYENDKIVQKKIRKEIIGEGYTSPMPDEFDLEKQFMITDEEEEQQNNFEKKREVKK